MVDASEDYGYSDFYNILEACTNDELTPIVNVLVNTPISLLKISRSFERFQPDHVRYTDRIGDEMYRLALLALGRSDGKRPSYSVMILAVCKKIGIPTVPDHLVANETMLLDVFMKKHLSSVARIDQQPLVDEARAAASAAASSILSSEAWSPFASLLLQMIYLRKKFSEEGRLSSSSQLTIAEIAGQIPDTELAKFVQHENGDPNFSLASTPEFETEWRDASRDSKFVNIFYPLLEAVQPLVAGSQMLSGEKIWRVSSQGTAHIVEKGHKGMRSLESVSVASLLGPTAFLTLASAMIEQKKLDNIEKSLDEIKSSISDVSKFQKAERHSVISGAIRYFQQVAPSVFVGELASEVAHEIERHEGELMRVHSHLIEEAKGQITVIHVAKKDTKAIQDAQINLDRMYGELLLCIRARACGYQLLCAFPGRLAGKRSRFEYISEALRELSPTGAVTVNMDQAIREKIRGASYETKALILTREQATLRRVEAESASILVGLKTAGHEPLEQAEPVYIDFKVQAGSIVGIRML